MMIPLYLIVRITGGDLDHASIGHDDRFEKSQRTTVLCRKELHLDTVADVKSVRPGSPDTSLRQGRGGAECQYPWGCRAIGILDQDRQRAVGIDKLYAVERPLHFHFLFHVVHAREGMMGLQRDGRDQAE